jgi:TatD DNase family protein
LTGLRWVDSHCHLEPASDGLEAVVAARAAGVERIVNVGTDLKSSVAARDFARPLEGVWATAGVHPHDASGGIDGIEALLSDDTVVAVGECGLDYHYEYSPRADQKDVFAGQIALAKQHGLPLVIHSREAWPDTFAILDSEGAPDRLVFHCFTGGADEARSALERGAHISFSGIVSFKSAADVREAAALCPTDRILIETDSPYLAPVPNRGRPNQPAWVALVGQAVAAARGVAPEVVAEHTWANTEALLNLN